MCSHIIFGEAVICQRIRLMASELNIIEIISRVFVNNFVIIATKVVQSILVFTVVLRGNTSLEKIQTGGFEDNLR